tara:strand:- start:1013 stop:1195 length:183 start_codon:yes stop_codon:yes gene_type:complete
MPLYSDEIDLFHSYCNELDNSNIIKQIDDINNLIDEIKDEELKDKLLSSIRILRLLMNNK